MRSVVFTSAMFLAYVAPMVFLNQLEVRYRALIGVVLMFAVFIAAGVSDHGKN